MNGLVNHLIKVKGCPSDCLYACVRLTFTLSDFEQKKNTKMKTESESYKQNNLILYFQICRIRRSFFTVKAHLDWFRLQNGFLFMFSLK